MLKKVVTLAVLCLFLGGCVVSEAPLAPQATLPHSSPLLGAWVTQSREETVYLHIGNTEQGIKLVEVEHKTEGVIKTESYLAAATTIGAQEYLSVQTPKNGRMLFTFIKYRLSDDRTLTLWPADEKFLATAIKTGLISGTIRDSAMPDIVLRAGQEALQHFVLNHGDKMFPEPTITLRKIPRIE